MAAEDEAGASPTAAVVATAPTEPEPAKVATAPTTVDVPKAEADPKGAAAVADAKVAEEEEAAAAVVVVLDLAVVLPDQPRVTLKVAAHELVWELVRALAEAPATSYYSCYALHWRGQPLRPTDTLAAVDGLVSGSELVLVEGPCGSRCGCRHRRAPPPPRLRQSATGTGQARTTSWRCVHMCSAS
jgi:hypothetical protein